MTTVDAEALRARRYLLGLAAESERAGLEDEYLRDEDALDRIEAAEDELIEDYLADQLSPEERRAFERDYLASAPHRHRVEVIRRLQEEAGRRRGADVAPIATPLPTVSTLRRPAWPWIALAAAVSLAVAGSLWLARSDEDAPASASRSPGVSEPESPAATPSQPPAPRNPPGSGSVLAISLSPIAVRAGADRAPVVVPDGTEALDITLEGDAGDGPALRGSASIQTVGGVQVWRGEISAGNDLAPGAIGRVRVPATSLPIDDYVVTLLTIDGQGRERERARYVLRVRSGQRP